MQRAIITRPILQNIQEGIAVICPSALPCPVLQVEASDPFPCGQFIPATDKVVMSLFFKSIRWEYAVFSMAMHVCVCVCVLWCVHMFVCAEIHPSIYGKSLLEVGVVRKGIDILLDHFVAELVLLLGRDETGTFIAVGTRNVFMSHFNPLNPWSLVLKVYNADTCTIKQQ